MSATVVVIGGGLAGLYAGRLLRSAGVDFLLLEARDRPGGRILSTDESGRASDDGFDLGPAWFWPGLQPAMRALVEELGLSVFAQNGDGDVLVERRSDEAPRRHHGMRHEPQSMRLVGGMGALAGALAENLPQGSLQLGARVTRIVLGEADVTLTVRRSDGTEHPLTAEQVIAALPPRLLAATIDLTPAMAAATAQHWRETATWMAPHAKFFALYDRPFWRDAGLSGTAQSMVGPLVEIHDATTASGAAALFGFLGVGANQRAALEEAVLVQACLEQLARLFGARARHPRATLLKDWAADGLTATADDRDAAGHPLPHLGPWVSGPWQDRLSLAGSETSATEPGYLAGAIDAARRAVEDALRRISARSPAAATRGSMLRMSSY